MAERKNRTRLVMIIAAIAFIILLVYLSRQQNQNQYEVCVTFKGASHCSTRRGCEPNGSDTQRAGNRLRDADERPR